MARTLRWSPPLVRLPVAEVVASAGEPLGAKVVVAAGEPLVQRWSPPLVSGTIIKGTLKAPNSQLVTPISTKLQRPDGCD
jgi:hypothetical protein